MDRKKLFTAEFRRRAAGMIRSFFLPSLTPATLLRMALVALTALVVFGFVLRPCFINGESMLPTYDRSGLVFCNFLRYWRDVPRRGDVVVISYFGRRYLLKRIIAMEGESIEFKGGKVLINGEELSEPYVRYPCSWDMEPVVVAPGHCFVVGDNRSQPQEEHIFGEVSLKRIAGGLLL